MAIAGIPEVINDFNMYNDGGKMVGITGEVEIPSMEAQTETVSGPGILGEYETPVVGMFGSTEMEIPFRVIDPDYFKMIDSSSVVALTLRGAIQYTVLATGGVDYMGMSVAVRGRCKAINLGTVKQGGAMESSITIELFYYKVELDGQTKIEYGKLTQKYDVNGNNLLSKVQSLI